MKRHSNYFRTLFIIPGIAVLIILSLSLLPFRSAPSLKEAEDSVVSIKLSFVGDLMCHSPQYSLARVERDSFNFVPVFREVAPWFRQADVLFGNLETVLAGNRKPYSGYPFFNSPDDYLVSLRQVGFNFLFTSNNHCLDQKEQGIRRTIEQLKERGIGSTGTFVSQKDRDSIRVLTVKGIKVALIAYTYGVNGNKIPGGKQYLVNIIDSVFMRADIARARTLKPDVIITYLHFGEEYERLPNVKQKKVVNQLIASGVDVVIASHPHVLQPVEYFKTNGGNLDTGFIAWSLGNFLSNQQWRYSDVGAIASLQLEKNIFTGKLRIKSVETIPTWVFKGFSGRKSEFCILPASLFADREHFSFLSDGQRAKMKQAFDDATDILTRLTANQTVR